MTGVQTWALPISVGGIWQSVWLKPVADLHIADLRALPDIDKGELTVDVALSNIATPSDAVRITARDKGKVIASTIIRGNRQGVLKIPNARVGSPDAVRKSNGLNSSH